MLQAIICRSSRRTKGQLALATPISASSSRASFIESMRSNYRLFSRFTRWTFRVGTTWFLHYCSDGRPSSPENHSKSFVTNDFQPSHSHLMAEAPEIGGGWGGWGGRRDLNPRQPEPQSGALPTELRPPFKVWSEFILT